MFLRATLISLMLYMLAIGLKSSASEGAVLAFSYKQLLKEIADTVPWLGAIFGGAYAALYTWFSSQWAYLSDLYNHQMSIALTVNDHQFDEETYTRWQAAYIEDAVSMHLETKMGISNVVYELLQDDGVRTALENDVHFGKEKVKKLTKRIEKVIGVEK